MTGHSPTHRAPYSTASRPASLGGLPSTLPYLIFSLLHSARHLPSSASWVPHCTSQSSSKHHRHGPTGLRTHDSRRCCCRCCYCSRRCPSRSCSSMQPSSSLSLSLPLPLPLLLSLPALLTLPAFMPLSDISHFRLCSLHSHSSLTIAHSLPYGADRIQRDRSRSRRRSRSPRRERRRSYDSRSRSRSRDDYRRNDRRSRSPINGAPASAAYPSSAYPADRGAASAPAARNFEDRSGARDNSNNNNTNNNMMHNVREQSQQDRRVYVGNLSYDVKWHHLKDFMRQGKPSNL